MSFPVAPRLGLVFLSKYRRRQLMVDQIIFHHRYVILVILSPNFEILGFLAFR